jgi:hypothetical protein
MGSAKVRFLSPAADRERSTARRGRDPVPSGQPRFGYFCCVFGGIRMPISAIRSRFRAAMPSFAGTVQSPVVRTSGLRRGDVNLEGAPRLSRGGGSLMGVD